MCNYIQFILLIQVLENSILFVRIKRKVRADIREKRISMAKPGLCGVVIIFSLLNFAHFDAPTLLSPVGKM